VSAEAEFIAFEEPAFELRVTERAISDLGCPKLTARGDLDEVEATSSYKKFVELFRSKYRDSPRGIGVPIHSVGRSDVISLHGPEGGRGARRVFWEVIVAPRPGGPS